MIGLKSINFSTHFDEILRHILFYEFFNSEIIRNIGNRKVTDLITSCNSQRVDAKVHQICLFSNSKLLILDK
jgi:hypothetical protein